jgi:hypothetical protein
MALQETGGSKVDAHVYLNYRYMGSVISHFGHARYRESLEWLAQFGSWSELDVQIKQREILMTGFTIVDSSGRQFMDLRNGTKTIGHDVINIIPFNTNLLLNMGITWDLNRQKSVSQLKQKLKVDPAELFALLDGEVALAGNGSFSAADNFWFLAKAADPDKLQQLLGKMSSNSGGRTISSGKYGLRQIKYEGLIPALFGKAFGKVSNNWYVFVSDFVVFGNSPQSLTNFIRYFETGKTLDLYEGFAAVSDNISGSSNLLLLLKPGDLLGSSGSLLNPETEDGLQHFSRSIKNIQGLAMQFSNTGTDIYTNFYLLSNPDFREASLDVWKTALDSKVSRKPYLVKDHKTGMFNIVCFDEDANMYLISTDGKILWKKRIDALPESSIYQVDYYKNGKIQYLFNTRDFIYLMDKNGNNVANYPKKLNPSSTNGLSLFDYENKKDYRLLVAQSDKRVYNYTIEGKQVKGWNKPKTSNIVSGPVTRLVADRKDYIIINDLDNRISIVDRRGNRRIKLSGNPQKAKNSSFYINKTNSKGIIITSNTKGKLTYIDKNGNLKYTDFGDFSPIHFFLYEDFNGDGAYDFIYVDGNELNVFDRFKNLLFSYTFETTISIRPEFFSLGRNQKVLGVVADQEKAIYLFDKKGNTIISRGLIGETPFTVGSIENNSEINLVTAAENVLYNYRLK